MKQPIERIQDLEQFFLQLSKRMNDIEERLERAAIPSLDELRKHPDSDINSDPTLEG